MSKLERSFFERDTLIVAKEMLGKYLMRRIGDKEYIGKIVETEAYIGEDDLACHAAKGRTKRTEIMYGEAGHAYIYLIYGMYHLINIITEKEGFPAAVLIRAVEPLDLQISNNELRMLGSGPGKLTRWMEIDREMNGIDVTKSNQLFVSSQSPGTSSHDDLEIVETNRVGVDYAKHCALHPWRFYIKDNEFVSKK